MNRRDSLSALLALALTGQSHGAFAQAGTATRRISFLCLSSVIDRLLRGVPPLLAKVGWVEGKNISYEWHAAPTPNAIPGLAAKIVAQAPDVIVADTNGTAQVTMQLTHAIPLVVVLSLDPVGAGLAQSLARPGRNATGLIWGEPRLAAKIVDFLHQAVPNARRFAVLYDPAVPGMQSYVDADAAVATALGMQSRVYHLRAAGDLAAVLESMRRDRIEAIKAAVSGHFGIDQLRQVLDYSSRQGIPTVSVGYFAVQLGALLGYYPNDSERLSRVSAQLDQLLRGAKASEMPFEYPSRFDLAVNLSTAKKLGITIPQSVMLSATSLVD